MQEWKSWSLDSSRYSCMDIQEGFAGIVGYAWRARWKRGLAKHDSLYPNKGLKSRLVDKVKIEKGIVK